MAQNCGTQHFAVTPNSPNIVLVIDKSGSMSQSASAGSTSAKWDDLRNAVAALMFNYGDKVNWGLSLFPSDLQHQSCTAGTMTVPLGAGNAQPIQAAVSALSASQVGAAGGMTPTHIALGGVAQSGGLTDPMRNNYIILMTDGEPNCGSDPTQGQPDKVDPIIAQLFARTPSVKTYVVGLGTDTASNPGLLSKWANTGHTARPNGTAYYQANSAIELTTAFGDIVAGLASCSYHVSQVPPDPSLLATYLDKVAIANDPLNGASYDAPSQSVVLNGAACQRLKSGMVQAVDMTYGCPVVPGQPIQ
jgi:hypothetical protein